MKAVWTGIGLLLIGLSIGWLTGCQSPDSSSNPNFSGQFPLIAQFYQNNSFEKEGTLQHFSSEEIKESCWGIQFNLLPPHVDKYPSDYKKETLLEDLSVLLARASELGVKWARVSVNWSTIEDKHGNYHWTYLDSLLEGLIKEGIEPYLCLNGGHKTYTDELPPVVSELGMKSWLSFVKLMAGRYANKVKYWEIWNEPNYPSFWKPEPDAGKYVELVKETVFTIREYDQNAVILGGSLARMDLPYAREIFQKGIGEYIDVLTIHPYNSIPSGSIYEIAYPIRTPDYYLPSSHQYKDIRRLLKQYNTDMEIWQAECGYPSAQNSHGWTGTGPWGENIQAKWLLRRMLTDVANGIPVSAYFSLWEYKLNPEDRVTNRKGLLTLEEKRPKPSFYAYRNLISLIRGNEIKALPEDSDLEITCYGSFRGLWEEDVVIYKLKEKQTTFYCYWIPWRMQEYVKPGRINLKISNAELESPVLVDLLTGHVFNPGNVRQNEDTTTIEQLPIADYPLIVAGKKNVDLKAVNN
jgi:hypothetical protein